MPGHEPVLVGPSLLPDCDHHSQLVVGVLDRHQFVRVEADQRRRIGGRLLHASGLEGLPRQPQEGSLIFDEQLRFRARLAAGAVLQIGQAALAKRPAECLQQIDLSHRHGEVPPRVAQQPLDMPLLIRPANQAELLLEQIPARQPQKLPRQWPLTIAGDLRHGDARAVVAQAPRHSAEELKGPSMPFQTGLGALPRTGLHEDRLRVGQRHHQQGDLRPGTF